MAVEPMNADIFAGQSTTDDILNNRIPIDMSADITRKQENNAPFTVLLEMMNKFNTTTGRKFEWMEQDDYQNTVTLSAAYTANSTVMTMADDYVRLRLGDMLLHRPTNMYFRVTTDGAMDATVDVNPNFPTGTGSLNIAAGEELFLIGDAQKEGSDLRQTLGSKPTPKYNLLQQLRQPFKATGRLNASQLIGPGELEYLDQNEYRAFSRAREMAFLFGKRGLDTTDGTSTSGGLEWFFNQAGSGTQQRDLSGKVLTQAEWEDFLKDAMYYMTDPSKVLLTGRNIPMYLNAFAKPHVRINMEAKKWGLHILDYETADGIVKIVPHKLFTELNMDDEGWIVDMPSLTRRGLSGIRSQPHLDTGINGEGLQPRGQDSTVYEYGVEEGLELRHSERFARIFNVAAP
jgi:hypothetical protein